MTIVSLSLPDQMVESMNEIQKSMGFSGRSELVRSAIRILLEDNREKAKLTGMVNGLMVVTHDQDREEPVIALKHRFEGIIRTHVHSKTTSTVCVELFIVHGPAKQVVDMSDAFRAEDKMKSAKLIPI